MIIEIISCPTRRGNQAKSARLATLIKNGLGITPSIIHGKSGQFEVRVDGQKVVAAAWNLVDAALWRWLSRFG
jgi:hypothetical protein